MKKWLVWFLICVLQFACTGREKIKLIPRRELIPLLVDINIADAIVSNPQLTGQFGNVDSASFYGSIYQKHHHTKQELDKTLMYYSNKPNKLIDIYNAVFAELSIRSENNKSTLTRYSAFENKTIWRSTKNIIIDGDTVSYPHPLDIRIDSVGHYLITALIKMENTDQSINPRIKAYFYDSSRNDNRNITYFKEFPLTKSNFDREYQLEQVVKNPALSHLRIIIPEYDSTGKAFHKNIKISNISVIRLRAKAPK